MARFEFVARICANTSYVVDARENFRNPTQWKDQWNDRNCPDTYERFNKNTAPPDRRDPNGRGSEFATVKNDQNSKCRY